MNWTDYKEKYKAEHPEEREELESEERICKTLAVIIRKRESLGLTQRQLAEKCGMKQSVIARIESYGANPSLKTLDKILSALNSEIALKETKSACVETVNIPILYEISTVRNQYFSGRNCNWNCN